MIAAICILTFIAKRVVSDQGGSLVPTVIMLNSNVRELYGVCSDGSSLAPSNPMAGLGYI